VDFTTDWCFKKNIQTRSGLEARIYATDGGGTYPVHGAAKLKDGWDVMSWTASGQYDIGGHCSEFDLMEGSNEKAKTEK